jgi:glycine/D-amino acid oxidase-like deaminating enzyme
MTAPETADVVVIGAGIVGAACATYAARAGLRVCVVDRGPVAGGSTGAGEGNLLVSDKPPGPELELMLRSLRLWQEIGQMCGVDAIELEAKGGLVVVSDGDALAALRALGARHRAAGVDVADVTPDDLPDLEPHLAAGLAGAAAYPQDMQVQPMLAAAHLLRVAAREYGVSTRFGATVTGIDRAEDGRVTAVRTTTGRIATAAVVNAAGVWAADVAGLAGVSLPVLPRRGFILVTQPLPPLIRHKVYAAEYLANVASDAADLQSSPVVEGTRSGTVLIGSSRERVGFDRTMSLPVLRRLAGAAMRLFPVLGEAQVIRAYQGFRPYSPDHLPFIGPDPRRPGLLHATGHEGAGIGLAPATGELVAAALTGADPAVDLRPFRPDRFDAHANAGRVDD